MIAIRARRPLHRPKQWRRHPKEGAGADTGRLPVLRILTWTADTPAYAAVPEASRCAGFLAGRHRPSHRPIPPRPRQLGGALGGAGSRPDGRAARAPGRAGHIRGGGTRPARYGDRIQAGVASGLLAHDQSRAAARLAVKAHPRRRHEHRRATGSPASQGSQWWHGTLRHCCPGGERHPPTLVRRCRRVPAGHRSRRHRRPSQRVGSRIRASAGGADGCRPGPVLAGRGRGAGACVRLGRLSGHRPGASIGGARDRRGGSTAGDTRWTCCGGSRGTARDARPNGLRRGHRALGGRLSSPASRHVGDGMGPAGRRRRALLGIRVADDDESLASACRAPWPVDSAAARAESGPTGGAGWPVLERATASFLLEGLVRAAALESAAFN